MQFRPLRSCKVSIHAPARGATQVPSTLCPICLSFQFTPLREGRRVAVLYCARMISFNSRPCERGDGNFSQKYRFKSVKNHWYSNFKTGFSIYTHSEYIKFSLLFIFFLRGSDALLCLKKVRGYKVTVSALCPAPLSEICLFGLFSPHNCCLSCKI